MLINVVATSYPRHPEDHAGRFVWDQNVALQGLGHEVRTLCPSAPGAPDEEEDAAGVVRRIRYASPGDQDLFFGSGLEFNAGSVRNALGKMRRFVAGARSALRGAPGDVGVAHWLWPSALPLIPWCRRGGRPLLGVAHGGDLRLLGRPVLGRGLGLRLRHRFSGVLVTHDSGRLLVERRRYCRGPVLVTPMGVDSEFWRKPRGNSEGAGSYLVGAGRFIPIKGFDLLIRAAADVGLPLVLAGAGPLEASLRVLASDLGADVRFLGWVTAERWAAVLQHARALVIPSREIRSGTEGCPMVALEGLAAGVPVIASATGGLASLLPASHLVPTDDPAALAERIRVLLGSGLPSLPPDLAVSRIDVARRLLGLIQGGPAISNTAGGEAPMDGTTIRTS